MKTCPAANQGNAFCIMGRLLRRINENTLVFMKMCPVCVKVTGGLPKQDWKDFPIKEDVKCQE